MKFIKKLFYKFKKLFTKYDTFVVNIFINIPTKPKNQKPYYKILRLKQKTLFDL